MKIVILDGYTTNPGELDWSALKDLGEVRIYDRTAKNEILKRAEGATALLTNKTTLDRETLLHLSSVKYIGVLASGYNVVDVDTASERGIVVTNVPGYSTASVAQHVFALIAALTNHAEQLSGDVHKGRWGKSKDFCFWDDTLLELDGKTFGILGLGAIGSRVATIARAFGMRVIAWNRTPKKINGIEFTGQDEVFRQSHIVSLHLPLVPETACIVNQARVSVMRHNAIIINTSRGGLIDEPALAAALNEKQIYGAGIDVLTEEPPREGSPLIGARNCIITPHVGWASYEARKRLIEQAAKNLKGYITGNPVNIVKRSDSLTCGKRYCGIFSCREILE